MIPPVRFNAPPISSNGGNAIPATSRAAPASWNLSAVSSPLNIFLPSTRLLIFLPTSSAPEKSPIALPPTSDNADNPASPILPAVASCRPFLIPAAINPDDSLPAVASAAFPASPARLVAVSTFVAASSTVLPAVPATTLPSSPISPNSISAGGGLGSPFTIALVVDLILLTRSANSVPR